MMRVILRAAHVVVEVLDQHRTVGKCPRWTHVIHVGGRRSIGHPDEALLVRVVAEERCDHIVGKNTLQKATKKATKKAAPKKAAKKAAKKKK
jgi:hypothetical protein